ncbi:hypothetical protein F8M41_016424 [Gigaspora margarita]|uniref:Uncharacterized protein n=1 Tax=Gigaspora margarita TaxID=4874 RepID=A0A8H4APK7_GIGMA|nr:hypothetical protein F8M41_016424 [Gigaspora margarita]
MVNANECTLLEGELDLKDFVNLQYLYVYGAGPGQDQQQKLTNLKIDKCNKLTSLQCNNPPISKITVGENKQLITDLAKKIEEENLEHQVSVTKSKFNEDYKLWLDILLETQQEVLQNDNTFARKQLEKIKKRLSTVLTTEEIQELLGKVVEINELEIQLKNLKI